MANIRVMIPEEEIKAMVKKIGQQITDEYKELIKDAPLMIIGVLKGAYIFMSDLVRAIDLPIQMDFIQASSYIGTESSGFVNITKNVDISVEGKHIIIVEDILDTGRTLNAIKTAMLAQNSKSVKIAAFLDKPARRKVKIDADYCCCQIPDNFVVGYGLDYDEDYRQLPYVGIVEL